MSLSYRQIIASMGSAVVAALLASAFGAKGTIIGVAIGAASATFFSALFSHSLDRTHEVVKRVLADPLASSQEASREEASVDRDELKASPQPGLSHPYLRLLASGAFIFLLALMSVTGIELILGRPLPTLFGVSEPKGSVTSVGAVLTRQTDPQMPAVTTTSTVPVTSSSSSTKASAKSSTSLHRSTTTAKRSTTTSSSSTTSSSTTTTSSSTTTSTTAP